MKNGLDVGSHVFIVENNRTVTEVVVAAQKGEFYIVRFLYGGAVRLRRNRIYSSKEEAEAVLSKKQQVQRKYRSPYDYGI